MNADHEFRKIYVRSNLDEKYIETITYMKFNNDAKNNYAVTVGQQQATNFASFKAQILKRSLERVRCAVWSREKRVRNMKRRNCTSSLLTTLISHRTVYIRENRILRRIWISCSKTLWSTFSSPSSTISFRTHRCLRRGGMLFSKMHCWFYDVARFIDCRRSTDITEKSEGRLAIERQMQNSSDSRRAHWG